MAVNQKIQSASFTLGQLLSAANKLSPEEKQILRQQLFAFDALSELKAFETKLKKKKGVVKKTDQEIVSITTAIRQRKYANAKKMLH